ncbi:hypothetical protein [Hymenobacter ruricola]|uniref:Adhesin n=1 Tax=Hymenobacter ruricola TaxID=2791023 RepID=A0ABS0I6V4_9BACT|nr:hypothetical protein [Hymenobacter ruricola]MBF9222675.1 hypothetical protein [Hymenobacter ruricola]
MPASTPLSVPKDRKTLKNYFRKGSLPTEQHFADLIDSAVNRLDDGFTHSPDNGWQVAGSEERSRLLALYQDLKKLEAKLPSWLLELPPPADGQPGGGLSFSVPSPPDEVGAKARPAATGPPPNVSRLHLQADGKVGIGTTRPTDQLDVRGFVASQGRIGMYVDAAQPSNEVAADGEWKTIISGLNGLNAFEIVAAAYGPSGSGRYAITHATALSAFGRSRSRVYQRDAWFWGWFQKIKFRWVGGVDNYALQMRTASSFGDGSRIVYHITQLFDDRRPVAPAATAAAAVVVPAAAPAQVL